MVEGGDRWSFCVPVVPFREATVSRPPGWGRHQPDGIPPANHVILREFHPLYFVIHLILSACYSS